MWPVPDKECCQLQEADGSLRFRRADDSKQAVQLHGLSRCVPAAPGDKLLRAKS